MFPHTLHTHERGHIHMNAYTHIPTIVNTLSRGEATSNIRLCLPPMFRIFGWSVLISWVFGVVLWALCASQQEQITRAFRKPR